MRQALLLMTALALPLSAEDSGCPTDAFMDVTRTAGAGESYPRPRLEVQCEEGSLVVLSNAIPHYRFVQITPNPLLELNRNYRMPLDPKLAEKPSPLPLFGPSGVAINGIPIFGPNEGPVPPPGFGDPVYNSIMDACMGAHGTGVPLPRTRPVLLRSRFRARRALADPRLCGRRLPRLRPVRVRRH